MFVLSFLDLSVLSPPSWTVSWFSSNKECCKQCRYVMFRGTMTKWPVQKLTQGTTQKLLQHHDATDIKKNYSFSSLENNILLVVYVGLFGMWNVYNQRMRVAFTSWICFFVVSFMLNAHMALYFWVITAILFASRNELIITIMNV